MRNILFVLLTLAVCFSNTTSFSEMTKSDTKEFVLGPGDVLEVVIWEEPTLTRDVLVRPDGIFSFPLIGEIEASGRSIAEVQEEINAKISSFVSDAPATVLLKSLNSQSFSVVGKVNKPGQYPLFSPIRVIDAIAIAGGLTPFADDDIKIIRETAKGQQTHQFDYGKVIRGKELWQNILLQKGDTIVVD